VPGVIDGHRPRARAQPCHALPLQEHRQRHPDQDDDDGHGPWVPSRGILERGRQAFDILRRVGGSASAGGSRERTLLAKL